jgi:hypothetical protein
MPKLAAKDRKKVEKAEATTGGFEPIKPGKYIAELHEVEAKVSNNGNPMWVAEFHEIHDLDGEKVPGRQWYQMMLPTTDTPPDGYTPGGKEKDPAKAWKMYQDLCSGRIKAFFEAFGYTPDSDTDEMIGERVVLQIAVRTIQNGPKAGEQGNEVKNIFPLDSVDFEDAEGEDGDEF